MYRILIIEDDRGIAEAIKEQAEMWVLDADYIKNFMKRYNNSFNN